MTAIDKIRSFPGDVGFYYHVLGDAAAPAAERVVPALPKGVSPAEAADGSSAEEPAEIPPVEPVAIAPAVAMP